MTTRRKIAAGIIALAALAGASAAMSGGGATAHASVPYTWYHG